MWLLDFEADVATQRVVCVQWSEYEELGAPVLITNEPEEIRRTCARALDAGFVAHYASYEARRMQDMFGLSRAEVIALYEAGRIVDSFTAVKLRDIREIGELQREGYGLAALTDKDGDDPWRMRYGELAHVKLEDWPYEALAYCLGDIVKLAPLWQWARPTNEVEWSVLREKSRNQYCLDVVAEPGPPIDAARVDRLVTEMTEQVRVLASHMPEFFEPKSKKDPTPKRKMKAIEAYAESIGLSERTVPTAKYLAKGGLASEWKGKIRLSEDALRECEDDKMQAYQYWVSINGQRKRLDTKYRGTHIGTRYNIAASGRYVSSAPEDDPYADNLTTMPRKGLMRNVIYAPEGKLLSIGDYSQLEVVTFADILHRKFPPSALTALLKEGCDLHKRTAAELLGVTYEEVAAAVLAEESTDGGPYTDARQMCKVPNFGGPGFMGAQALKNSAWKDYEMRLPLAKCKALLNAWKRVVPEHAPFFNEAQVAMHFGGLVTLPDGFSRKCDRVGNYCNTQFQYWGARIATEWLARTLSAGYDVRLFAHDELVTLIDDDQYATERTDHIAQLGEEAGRSLLSPDGPPLRVESALARRWDKKAKSKRIDGRLTVWDRP